MKSQLSSLIVSLLCVVGVLEAKNQEFKLICPGDLTIRCSEDYADLNRYGRAYTDHNGYIQYIHDCKVVIDISPCGIGTIKRTWGVEDPETWEWLVCTQIITVTNIGAFGPKDIEWPLSVTLEGCNPEADWKALGKPYDKPYWKKITCSMPMLSFKDTRYEVHPGCIKIVREWKVLDWCLYDPVNYPGRGIYSSLQVIKLITVDSVASIVCKKDTIVLATLDCKGAYVNLPKATLQISCPMFFTIRNTSPYADSSGDDASGFYPNGITKFEFIAEYGCGKELKCEVIINVQNKIPPTPYCLTGIIIDLMPVDADLDGIPEEGMVEVWASDLDKGSFHKCPGQILNFSFSSDILNRARTFTCANVGINDVEIWITDSLGNQDFCKTTIEIQNNIGIPNCEDTGNIHGKRMNIHASLKDIYDRDVYDQFLSLKTIDGIHIETKSGNAQHIYSFDEIPTDRTYKLDVKQFQYDKSKIDQNDLKVLLQLIQKPGSFIQMIAADINMDYKVDISDYYLLKQFIQSNQPIHFTYPFRIIDPSDPAFITQDWPSIKIQEEMILPELSGSSQEINYLVIQLGDLLETSEKITGETLKEEWTLDVPEQNISKHHDAISMLPIVVNSANGSVTEIRFTILSECNQRVSLQLFDIAGRMIKYTTLELQEGTNTILENLDGSLNTALSIYRISKGNQLLQGKIITGF
ncbi:MAG: hypothetical protein M3Q56_05400 [Bacteroidota bacterium]|nr:hypothetical protein [Bacteroidota bacterium]